MPRHISIFHYKITGVIALFTLFSTEGFYHCLKTMMRQHKRNTGSLSCKLQFYYYSKIHSRARRDLQKTPNPSFFFEEVVIQVLRSYRSPMEMETPKAYQAIYSLSSPLKFSVISKINLSCCNLSLLLLVLSNIGKENRLCSSSWSNLLHYVFTLFSVSD